MKIYDGPEIQSERQETDNEKKVIKDDDRIPTIEFEQNPAPNKIDKIKTFNVYFLNLNASLGFLYFGYNLAVFSPTQNFLSNNLKWGTQKNIFLSIISAMLPLGAMLGSIFSGKIASSIGRRNSLMIIDIVAFGINLLTLISNSYVLIISKFIQGICIGAYSSIIPLYINEYVPMEMKGKCGNINNALRSGGVLLALALSFNLPSDPTQTSNNWWRFMFGLSSLYSLINLILLFFYFKEDTPKYLYLSKDDPEGARKALNYIYNDQQEIENYLKIMVELQNDQKNTNIDFLDLFKEKYLKRLLICITINFIQQFTGINGFGPFINFIFLKFTPQKVSIFWAFLTGVGSFASGFLAMLLIERLGRRLLFLGGLILTVVLLFLLGALFYNQLFEPVKYIFVLYFFVINASMNMIVWVYNADLLPDKGVGICAMMNWIFSFTIAMIFPSLVDSNLNISGTCFLFGSVSIFGIVFISYFMKETKGKSFIEIEKEFEN